MDAFYASVEQHDDPKLKGRPVAVGGSRRGVVAAASYEARRFGVRSAMPVTTALRLCPKLVRVPPRMDRYQEISQQVRAIFHDWTELVEPLSLDEAFLDVTESCRKHDLTATRLARRLKNEILAATGLTASAGVAATKFVAKIASDYRKPDGLTVVVPERTLEFLHPLPVSRIWGVGPKTAERLERLGILTILDLFEMELEELLRLFGKAGLAYYRLARGQDDRPVKAQRRCKSLSTERTFARDLDDEAVLRDKLLSQAQELQERLRRRGYKGSTVVLKLRYGDFTTITRSHTLSAPTDRAEVLFEEVMELLKKTEFPQRAVRLAGLGLSGLIHPHDPVQLTLFS